MRAVIFRGEGEIAIENVPCPTRLTDTDAIVRVSLAGICGTDLHAIRGDFPGVGPGTVIGHEFVGTVVEVGAAVKRFRSGDRVMSSDFTACGRCHRCDDDQHWQCSQRAFFGTGTAFGPALQGAQAEFVRVPHADTTLGELPSGCSSEAGLLMADNLATGWTAAERARVQAGDCVVVIGGGAVGQLTALSAQAQGAGLVIVVEPNAARQEFARSQGSLAVHPDAAAELVSSVTAGRGANVVLEAVGGAGPLDLAVALAGACARVVSVGVHSAKDWAFPVARAFTAELNLGFAIGNAIRLRRKLFRLIASGAFDPTVVIDARGNLDDAPRLYHDLAAQRFMKAVIAL